MQWPFRHNWSVPYRVTWSYQTIVLTAHNGFEQRIADRDEPRRSITTEVLDDGRGAQTFDRFLWGVGSGAFDHVDPTDGRVSVVRLDESQTLSHPAARVVAASVALSVDPGSDDRVYGEPDILSSFEGRYVFPFPVNWTGGRTDTVATPRRTVDFGRGRIAVTRPVAFNTRNGAALLLRVGRTEADALTDFFAAMRGRQGEFWAESLLDDLTVLEIVSTTIVVDGSDVTFDPVNAAVSIRTWGGNRYFRRIVDAETIGDTTYLQMDAPLPDDAPAVRQCSWMRVSRFSSDDMTLEWTTSTVMQVQVQVQSLPYITAEPASPLSDLEAYLLDYIGGGNYARYSDRRNYVVNTQIPRLSA